MTRTEYKLDQNYQNGAGKINPGFVSDLELNTRQEPKRNGELTSKVVEGPGDNQVERQQWDRPIEFLLSCIAMSVGLGNVWRFPFIAYQNGGGAFILPYLVVLFLIGKPLYFLEMSLGQFSSSGQVKVWKMAPIMKGIGYSAAIGTGCVLSYYCSLMAITVYYFFASFSSVLPWTVCQDSWEKFNYSCVENSTRGEVYNWNKEGNLTSASQVYFDVEVLKKKSNIDDGIGVPDLYLSLCLLLAWIIILFTLIKGVKSSGKVAYFTALFPYVVLIILLIRGVTLEGAIDGIWFFIKPDWKKILEPGVWLAAIGQMFFSLSTGFGPIIMFSSYNPFRHNAYRDAMIISLMDTFTSLLAGFTIFSVLGNLAFELKTDVAKVATGGPGLAFVSYPDAIAKFNVVPQLFAVLFFLMLFTLGLGSASSLAGGVITIITDQFPHFNKKIVTTVICIIGFFSGLIYVTPGGPFMVTLVDNFGANFVIYVAATLEIIGISWVYGLNNVVRDIQFMLNRKLSIYWKFCWFIFIPITLSIILIFSLIDAKPLKEDGVEFPFVAIVCGWMISLVALIVIPIAAFHAILTRKSDSFSEKFIESTKPTQDWGPKDPKTRQEWLNIPRRRSISSMFKEKIEKLKDISIKS